VGADVGRRESRHRRRGPGLGGPDLRVAQHLLRGWSYGIGLPLAGNEKAQMDEYKEVQPYFYGDFYPLIDYTLATDTWAAWQLDRPESKSGCVILMRRKDSPFTTMMLPLRKIDPGATYDVEVRLSLAHVPAQKMSGADLLKLSVTIPDQPGSALVFYRKE